MPVAHHLAHPSVHQAALVEIPVQLVGFVPSVGHRSGLVRYRAGFAWHPEAPPEPIQFARPLLHAAIPRPLVVLGVHAVRPDQPGHPIAPVRLGAYAGELTVGLWLAQERRYEIGQALLRGGHRQSVNSTLPNAAAIRSWPLPRAEASRPTPRSE